MKRGIDEMMPNVTIKVETPNQDHQALQFSVRYENGKGYCISVWEGVYSSSREFTSFKSAICDYLGRLTHTGIIVPTKRQDKNKAMNTLARIKQIATAVTEQYGQTYKHNYEKFSAEAGFEGDPMDAARWIAYNEALANTNKWGLTGIVVKPKEPKTEECEAAVTADTKPHPLGIEVKNERVQFYSISAENIKAKYDETLKRQQIEIKDVSFPDFSMHDICDVKHERPSFHGVMYKEGEMFAGSSSMIVSTRCQYDPNKEGKSYDRNGNEINLVITDEKGETRETKVPRISAIKPNGNADVYMYVNVEHMLKFLKAVISANRGTQPRVLLNFSHAIEAYDAHRLMQFVRAARHFGAGIFEFRLRSQPISFMTDDAWGVLMPMAITQDSEVADGIYYAYHPKLAETPTPNTAQTQAERSDSLLEDILATWVAI